MGTKKMCRILKFYAFLIGVTFMFLVVNIIDIDRYELVGDRELYLNSRTEKNTIDDILESNIAHDIYLKSESASSLIDSNNNIEVQIYPNEDTIVNNIADKNTGATQTLMATISDNKNVDIDKLKYKDDNTELPFTTTEKNSTQLYSIAELRERAKLDKQFLVKILNQSYLHSDTKEIFTRYFIRSNNFLESEYKSADTNHRSKEFDIDSDVMVFLHIQKTGGMYFNDRLVSALQIPFQCNCQKETHPCKCLNPNGNTWMYTFKFNGWPCGLHADWTQLHRCIPGLMDIVEGKRRERRYFYFTQLRDPIDRYLSEFHHQGVNGGHWQDTLLGCGSGFPDWTDIRPCFHTESWRGVSLDEFMACPHNLATNRMTRMLADLNLANCYKNYLNRTLMVNRAIIWLESAKENLQHMEYFGFMEDGRASDKLFSSVFQMQFRGRRFRSPTQSLNIKLTEDQFLKLLPLIELDFHIYLFAKGLFEHRLSKL